MAVTQFIKKSVKTIGETSLMWTETCCFYKWFSTSWGSYLGILKSKDEKFSTWTGVFLIFWGIIVSWRLYNNVPIWHKIWSDHYEDAFDTQI